MKTTFTILIVLPFFAYAQSPGGVSSNIQLWLKANDGAFNNAATATDGQGVSSWQDKSGARIRRATDTIVTGYPSTSTAYVPPAFRNNTTDNINYNPVVDFDGVDDALDFRDDYIFSTGTAPENGMTWLALLQPDATTGKPEQFVFDFGGYASSGYGMVYGSSNYEYYAAGGFGGMSSTTVSHGFSTQSVLANFTIAFGSSQSFSVNGSTLRTDPITLPKLTTAEILEAATHGIAGDGNPGPFTIGRQSKQSSLANNGGRLYDGSIAELIGFSRVLSAAELKRVESYISIKYGITLSNSGGGTAGDYTSSGGALIWDASDGSSYHKNVIGIGRDDNSALLQKQSRTLDDTTRVYLSSLSTTNAGNSGSFASNESFVMAGNNGREMFSTGSTEYPTGQGIYTRLNREWKITNTSFSGTFSMDFKPKFTNVTAADLRVLIDADGDFSNAIMHNPTIAYNSGVITVTGIDNTMVPSGSTRYLTLVSLAPTTPLPVLLTSFTAQPKSETVQLEWTTASEQNNAWFAVERSADREHWQQIGKVAGAGNSSQTLHYSYTDVQPLNGISYYRLKQTDADGAFKYSPLETVRRQATKTSLRLYPNPVSNEVIVKGNRTDLQTLKVFDLLGRDVTQKLQMRNDGASIIVNMAGMPGGLYIFKIRDNSYEVLKR